MGSRLGEKDMTLTHSETIEIPLDKLNPTFHYISTSWKPYLDTWKMVDEGEENARSMPLYALMLQHYYNQGKERLEYERKLLGLKTAEPRRIARRWVEIHIELYKSIKQRGYIEQMREKPIQVRIKADGSFRLADGTHTVSILKHLGYESVKATVIERDKEWIRLKQQLYDMYDEQLLYQPINHPDFKDWRIDRDENYRFNIISHALGDVNNDTVLDIGCNMGALSMKFADSGAKVTGIDPNQTRIDVSNIIADYHDYPEDNPLFLCEPFEEHLKRNRYDIVLVLSLLHHYLRRGLPEFIEAVKLISENCDVMVLEMGLNRLPVEWSPELVLEHSKYSSYVTIYEGGAPNLLI